jgi:hypothetical protein
MFSEGETMRKVNLNPQELSQLYEASRTKVEEVYVPPLNMITLKGKGSPGSPKHIESATVMFSVAQAIKSLLEENHKGLEYNAMPLEGLWWTKDDSDWLQAKDENRLWKLLMVQPKEVTKTMLEEAVGAFQKQKGKEKPSPLLSAVELEVIEEGRSAQMLHVGPYTEELQTVNKILEWIKENGGKNIGKHHEIYLDDATKTPPEQLRTILRYPFS